MKIGRSVVLIVAALIGVAYLLMGAGCQGQALHGEVTAEQTFSSETATAHITLTQVRETVTSSIKVPSTLTLTASDFDFLLLCTSLDEITERVGPPDRDIGAGTYIMPQYDLADGSVMTLKFNFDTDCLIGASIRRPDGTSANLMATLVAPRSLTLTDFGFLESCISERQVREIVGEPVREVGSGIVYHQYDLVDGGIVSLRYGFGYGCPSGLIVAELHLVDGGVIDLLEE
jgi:hypothetical protein